MIITSINSILYVEVVSFFRNLIRESINTCDKEGVIEYKTIAIDDFYSDWDILDQDGEDIEGIDIISDFIVLNDDTRTDLERAFEKARDEEFEAFVDECFYYVGQPNVLYADEADAIEAADDDFRNDIASRNEARYFDEDFNETNEYKEDFKRYISEKIMLFSDAGNVSVADIQEIR